jgi:hypothetical protein
VFTLLFESGQIEELSCADIHFKKIRPPMRDSGPQCGIPQLGYQLCPKPTSPPAVCDDDANVSNRRRHGHSSASGESNDLRVAISIRYRRHADQMVLISRECQPDQLIRQQCPLVIEESGHPAFKGEGIQPIDKLGNILRTAFPNNGAKPEMTVAIVNGHTRGFLSVPWFVVPNPCIALLGRTPQNVHREAPINLARVSSSAIALRLFLRLGTLIFVRLFTFLFAFLASNRRAYNTQSGSKTYAYCDIV